MQRVAHKSTWHCTSVVDGDIAETSPGSQGLNRWRARLARSRSRNPRLPNQVTKPTNFLSHTICKVGVLEQYRGVKALTFKTCKWFCFPGEKKTNGFLKEKGQGNYKTWQNSVLNVLHNQLDYEPARWFLWFLQLTPVETELMILISSI